MKWTNLLGAAVTALASLTAVIVVGVLDPATEIICQVAPASATVPSPTTSTTSRSSVTDRPVVPMPRWWPELWPVDTSIGTAEVRFDGSTVPPIDGSTVPPTDVSTAPTMPGATVPPECGTNAEAKPGASQ